MQRLLWKQIALSAFVTIAVLFAACSFNFPWPELSMGRFQCQICEECRPCEATGHERSVFSPAPDSSSAPKGLVACIPCRECEICDNRAAACGKCRDFVGPEISAEESGMLDGLADTPLSRNMKLPQDALDGGVAHLGGLERFQGFLHKVVVERKPITAVAVGGSITGLLAGQRGDQGELFNHELQTCARQCYVKNGWLATPLKWLTDMFPPKTMHPHASFNASGRNDDPSPFQLVNLGMGGRGPDVYFTCLGKTLLDSLPQHIDLLVVEYAINSPILEGDSKGMVESILQRLWKRDPGMAVLFVNFHYWCRPTKFTFAACRNASDGPKQSSPRTWRNMQGTFNDYMEESMLALAHYYDLPLLSFRNALYPLVANEVPGFGILDILTKGDGGWHPSEEQADGIYSDLIVHFLHSSVVSFAKRSRQKSKTKDSPSNGSKPATDLWYPPPEFASTLGSLYREQIQVCYFFDGLGVRAGSRPPIIIRSEGFEFQPDEDAFAPEIKRGFISRTPGSIAEVKLEWKPPSGLAGHSNVSTIIRVWHLISYERMGKASFECSQGCICDELVIDSTHTEPWSVPGIKDIAATFAPTNDCHISFKTMAGDKGGTKFKILSIEVIYLGDDID